MTNEVIFKVESIRREISYGEYSEDDLDLVKEKLDSVLKRMRLVDVEIGFLRMDNNLFLEYKKRQHKRMGIDR